MNDSMQGRIDSPLYRAGMRKARNFDVTAQGSLRKRNGVQYVWSSNDDDLTSVRWAPFRIADGRTLALLLTQNNIYAFLDGGQVTGSGGVTPATVATDNWLEHTATNPQTNIRWVQIGDSLYITRPTKPLAKLTISLDGSEQLAMTWEIVEFVSGKAPRPVSDFGTGGGAGAARRTFYIDNAANTLFEVDLNGDDDNGTALRNIDGPCGDANVASACYHNGRLIILTENNSTDTDQNRSLIEIDPGGPNAEGTKLRGIPSGLSNTDDAPRMCSHNGRLLILDDNEKLWELDLGGVSSQGVELRNIDLDDDSNEPGSLISAHDKLYVVTVVQNNAGTPAIWEIDPDAESDDEGTKLREFPDNISPYIEGLVSDGDNLLYLDYTGTNAGAVISVDPTGGKTEYTTVRTLDSGFMSGALWDLSDLLFESDGGIEINLETKGFSSIAYYQGRLALSGHPDLPNALFLSDVNAFNRFTKGTEDDDAVFLLMTQGPDSGIHWMKAWQDRLVMGSVWGIYQLRSGDVAGVVTPASFDIQFTSGVGTNLDTEALLTEEGLIFADNEDTGLFRYSYKDDTDIFSSRPFSNTLRDVNNRSVVGLHYANGTTPTIAIDSVGKEGATNEDLRNLTRVIFDERNQHMAGVEYLFPDEWSATGGYLMADNGVWFTMLNRPAGAPSSRHRFIVGFLSYEEERELDFGIAYSQTVPFSTILTGLQYLGQGTAIQVKDRVNGVLYDRTVDAGGLNANLDQPTTSIEVGLPFGAEFDSLRLQVQNQGGVSSFGQTGRVTKVRLLVRDTLSGAVTSDPSLRIKPVDGDTFIAATAQRTYETGLPYWIEASLEHGYTEDTAISVETLGVDGVEILAISLRFEMGNN